MKLRPYQIDVKDEIYAAWNAGASNVLVVMPTGAGKTIVLADIIREQTGPVCAIAHRQELVCQISLALARCGVRHWIIGPMRVVRTAVSIHMGELGASFYDPNASVAVAGVDTLVRRADELGRWLRSVVLWVQDEAHHVQRDNKWGRAASMFASARGLGVTATPCRADGRGLGRDNDGLFDCIVEGPSMRQLVNDGYLTDYRIFAPPSDIDLSAVNISKATGDYSKPGLVTAVTRSCIVGDVVTHYKRIAGGKLGVTFATDVATASRIADEFNAAGVAAAVVSATTPDAERVGLVRQFRDRKLTQLVNVDLFGEGFDLPAIEVVSMARPTQSYALYSQQFGRSLRPMRGKAHAIVIDHVGNVMRHGLPDAPKVWTLARREKRARGVLDTVTVKYCLNPDCLAVYERVHRSCPYCGYTPVPSSRSGPDYVDGDLCELDAHTLAAMREAVEAIDIDKEEFRARLVARHVPTVGQLAQVKRHVARQEAQAALRDAIALWAGYQRAAGRPDSESYRRFYLQFEVDVLSAQALGANEALALTERLHNNMEKYR